MLAARRLTMLRRAVPGVQAIAWTRFESTGIFACKKCRKAKDEATGTTATPPNPLSTTPAENAESHMTTANLHQVKVEKTSLNQATSDLHPRHN